MKTTLIKIPACICLLAFMACNEVPKGNAKGTAAENTVVVNPDDLPELPPNLTELSVALEDVKRYKDSCIARSGTVELKAFNLNTNDLLSALGQNFNPNGSHPFHARGYIGLDVNNKYKFYIVPVTGDSSMHISQTNPGRDTVIVGEYKHFYPDRIRFVYELNFPCPTLCDVNSVFYFGAN